MKLTKVLLLLTITVMLAACSSTTADKVKTAPEDDASGFVVLTDVVPDAILEVRYYGTYNFVGARVDGYLEPTVLLTREAADSLNLAILQRKAAIRAARRSTSPSSIWLRAKRWTWAASTIGLAKRAIPISAAT